ncbi:MAG: endolytic transglycosylase MltG [Xanthobacteraceae bacterium]
MAPSDTREPPETDKVDLPTRRSARARHPLVIAGNAMISLLVILAIAAGYGLYVGKQRFDAPGPLQQDKVIDVPRGAGLRDITNLLVSQGVIDEPWIFIGGVLVLKAREGLKAGEYQFKAHESPSDVVTAMSEGKVLIHEITIPEGLTSEQIVARLMDNDVLTGNIADVPPEGSMLPDTYSFTRGETREQLILHMQHAQQRLVQDIWTRRAPNLPLKTPEQLVILASMIEKETGKPEERTRIAAVFVNRLKKNMRLQSDPTIIYGLVGGKGSLGRPIMKSEIDQPTPYNTYQIDGLPPGPITNPGRASLEAAANPARTKDLYFVADGTGGHAFAETYEQHQKNVMRLRKLEAAQKDTADPDSPTPAQAAPPKRAEHAVLRRRRARRPRAATH